ncbi:type I-E CRISPR-associated protein Cse2/CasB [Limnobaculum xujianqingii]|uniref:type I-E CRISPR-associated protein Cse2/CasB n=1 Tax=Limnobaculum xujianqingii TaxID=2738837 RepID=UPI001126760F|nr:type I-E CRISPR-associated protein Cse2/CasB [Limnobaculum xujianqingii]
MIVSDSVADKAVRQDQASQFISYILQRCNDNKGFAARLRRADNPATEYQCWELLAAFNINLEWENQRLPYTTVAAAVAKAQIGQNGSLSLGRAIAACYDDGNESNQAKAKLRRVLACDSTQELCRILRPLLTMISSKAGQSLDYSRLLQQLLKFHWDTQKIKTQWAQEFYGGIALDQAEVK